MTGGYVSDYNGDTNGEGVSSTSPDLTHKSLRMDNAR